MELTNEFANEYMDVIDWEKVEVKAFKAFDDDTIKEVSLLVSEAKRYDIYRTVILEDNRIDLLNSLLGNNPATVKNISDLMKATNLQLVIILCISHHSNDIIKKIHSDNMKLNARPIYNFLEKVNSGQDASPLSFSIACNNVEMVEFFLENGATWGYNTYLAASAMCARYEDETFKKYFTSMYSFVADQVKPQLLSVVGGYEHKDNPELPIFKSLINRSEVANDALFWLLNFVTDNVKEVVSDIEPPAIEAMINIIDDIANKRGVRKELQHALSKREIDTSPTKGLVSVNDTSYYDIHCDDYDYRDDYDYGDEDADNSNSFMN